MNIDTDADLPSRLRNQCDYYARDLPGSVISDMHDAADEIERLLSCAPGESLTENLISRMYDEIKRLQRMVEAIHDIDFPVWSCEVEGCKYDATHWRWHGKDGTGWMCVCSDHQA